MDERKREIVAMIAALTLLPAAFALDAAVSSHADESPAHVETAQFESAETGCPAANATAPPTPTTPSAPAA